MLNTQPINRLSKGGAALVNTISSDYIVYFVLMRCKLGRQGNGATQPDTKPPARQGQTTAPGTPCPTLSEQCEGSFTSSRIMNSEELRDGANGLSSSTFYSVAASAGFWPLARVYTYKDKKDLLKK